MWVHVWTAPHHQSDVNFQAEAYPGIASAKRKETDDCHSLCISMGNVRSEFNA